MPKTLTVGCKLPNGIILQIPGAAPVRLNGSNSSAIAGGHGITPNVDAEFFERWKVLYADFPPLVNELIFAHEKAASTEAEAKEKVDNPSGFEGLDPDKPAPGVEPENYEGMPKPKKGKA